MATTVTTTESWGSRLGDSIKGVIAGLVIFVLGFPLLFWNEGNTVKTRKALEEGEGATVSLESNAKVDPDMDGRLVHISGRADTQDTLSDATFGVSLKAIRLERQVEMYQWEETSHTTEKKNLGGSVTKTTTYEYKKIWTDRVIDSSSFVEAGHDNPGCKEFADERQEAANVSFGAFRLSEWQISAIGRAQKYVLPQDYSCPVPRCQVQGSTIYIPNTATRSNELNRRNAVAEPRIGDMRVTFYAVLPHDISLVAKQKGDTFVAYVAKNGKKVQLLSDGVQDAAEMFADAQSANTVLCWLVRILGFTMMFGGIKAVLKPISVLADVLPILGDIVGIGLGVVAFAVAMPCALVTIAIAWLFYRPVTAAILIAVAAGIVYWFAGKRAKAKKAAEAGNAPAASAEPAA